MKPRYFLLQSIIIGMVGLSVGQAGESDGGGKNISPAEANKAVQAGASPIIKWKSFHGFFTMDFELEPARPALWQPADGNTDIQQSWTSGPYRLEMRFEKRADQTGVMHYKLVRSDGQSFRIMNNLVEVRTSIARVYKTFTPDSISREHYVIDLPRTLQGEARAVCESPMFWIQDPVGCNTLTVGMLDQIPYTLIRNPTDGKLAYSGEAGEAQGIANSYYAVDVKRYWYSNKDITSFEDGVYINADPRISWFDALSDYAAAVDANRNYQPGPPGKNAFRPMWHSWYAHASAIDQKEFLVDAKIAAGLGIRTMQIDAGWNVPPREGYSVDIDGDYQFDPERFPDVAAMIDQIHDMDMKVILHVGPLVMGKKAKVYARMEDALLRIDGKPIGTLDPRLKKTHDFLLAAWEKLMAEYKMDGLWYDFMELLPHRADPPAAGMEIVSPDMHEAYTLLMKALYDKARSINPDALIVFRRNLANLNAKLYCTHVWPYDSPQDYHTNRRDVVYMKTFGKGVVTHACCTCWPISETNENVARHMASVTLAGVPAISVKLVESPERHNEIIRAWLAFYGKNDKDLVTGRMIPLLPTPFSAAVRIESEKQAFFGFFEAVLGLLKVSRPFDKITLVNAFSDQLATRLEGVQGEFQYEVFDRAWKSVSTGTVRTDQTGLNLNIIDKSGCFSVVLTQKK